jgi:hypothetical protein
MRTEKEINFAYKNGNGVWHRQVRYLCNGLSIVSISLIYSGALFGVL